MKLLTRSSFSDISRPKRINIFERVVSYVRDIFRNFQNVVIFHDFSSHRGGGDRKPYDISLTKKKSYNGQQQCRLNYFLRIQTMCSNMVY